MSDRVDYRDLGMHRRIPRRDFLNGIAIAVTGGSLRAAAAEVSASARGAQQASASARSGSEVCPPALTGLRGNDPAAIATFSPMQSGAYRAFPALAVDTSERYALLIAQGLT